MSDLQVTLIVIGFFAILIASIWYAARSLEDKEREDIVPPLPVLPKKTSYSEIELEILFEINEVREALALPLLTLEDTVSLFCESHMRDLIRYDKPLSHDGVGQRFSEIKAMIPYLGIAEVLAYGYRTAPAIVKGWVNSTGHYASITGNFNRMGVSVQYDSEGKSYTSVILIR